MIPSISRALDKRFLIRRNLVGHKRLKFYHENPTLREALEEASWILNPIGMKLLFDNIKLCEQRWSKLVIVDDGVEETFSDEAHKTYFTDGRTCSCSYFLQMMFCRHIVFFRINSGLAVFEEQIFHPCLLKTPPEGGENLDDVFVQEFNASPQSPGMQMVMLEKKNNKKIPSQAKKFNLALDVGREMAEIISTYDTSTFEEVLESCKCFMKQVRKGLPEDLANFLKSPESFAIVPATLLTEGLAGVRFEVAVDNSDSSPAERLATGDMMEIGVQQVTMERATELRTGIMLQQGARLERQGGMTLQEQQQQQMIQEKTQQQVQQQAQQQAQQQVQHENIMQIILKQQQQQGNTRRQPTQQRPYLSPLEQLHQGKPQHNRQPQYQGQPQHHGQPQHQGQPQELDIMTARAGVLQRMSGPPMPHAPPPGNIRGSSPSLFISSTAPVFQGLTSVSSYALSAQQIEQHSPVEGVAPFPMGGEQNSFLNLPNSSEVNTSLWTPAIKQEKNVQKGKQLEKEQTSSINHLKEGAGVIKIKGEMFEEEVDDYSERFDAVESATSYSAVSKPYGSFDQHLYQQEDTESLLNMQPIPAVVTRKTPLLRNTRFQSKQLACIDMTKYNSVEDSLTSDALSQGGISVSQLDVSSSPGLGASLAGNSEGGKFFNFSFSGDDYELPEPTYTPISESEKLQFIESVKSKGRPRIKREPALAKSTPNFLETEMRKCFPMKTEVMKPKQRKGRSDKGKKRGPYKIDLPPATSQSDLMFHVRATRAPKNSAALHREYGDTTRPVTCYTCGSDLVYDWMEGEDGDKVVICSRCNSFIHSRCLNECRFCEGV